MRMKSTGIVGDLEMLCEISDIRPKDGWLIVNIRTTTPVGWNLRVALSHADILTLLKLLCKPSNLACILFGFGRSKHKERIPDY